MTLLTVNEVARELQVSRYTVYDLFRTRQLPYIQATKARRRVSRVDLDKYLERRRTA
jgi:excisionase family DNA binding protein